MTVTHCHEQNSGRTTNNLYSEKN